MRRNEKKGESGIVKKLAAFFEDSFFKTTPDGVVKSVSAPAETCSVCGDYSYKCSYTFTKEKIVVDVDHDCCGGTEIKCSTPHLNSVIRAVKKYYKGVR